MRTFVWEWHTPEGLWGDSRSVMGSPRPRIDARLPLRERTEPPGFSGPVAWPAGMDRDRLEPMTDTPRSRWAFLLLEAARGFDRDRLTRADGPVTELVGVGTDSLFRREPIEQGSESRDPVARLVAETLGERRGAP